MRKKRKQQLNSLFPITVEKLEQLMNERFENNPDLSISTYEHQDKKIAVFFIGYLIQSDKVENFLVKPLLESKKEWTNNLILNEIPIGSGQETKLLDDILEGLIIGEVFVYIENEDSAINYLLPKKEKRSLAKAETESVVIGPQVAFTESMVTNLNLIRWGLRSTDLVLEKIMVGKRTPREVRLVYLKSIANETDINTMRQRLQEVEVDAVEDSNVLMQYIEDSSTSIFPQFYSTELPDRAVYSLTNGRIAVLVENSPTAIIAPTTFFNFFESTEDLYMRWNAGSFLRLLRFIAMFISVTLTPMYVAAVTFHYEIIPTQLLISIGQSRAGVPFPPIFEALFLELMIELLREAGARLPTKVGQTIGIVGGVVIGTAAVQAGITSNILIIFITISALASFTAPSYLMGTSIRVLRFPMIILAGILGIIGIMFGICFMLIHLLKLTSLGRPYLSPIYPLRLEDFNKVLFRLPQNYQWKRFTSFRPKDLTRFSKNKAAEKKDIDE
ncbi:spore germination protein [Virgibacillus profundi]|uniref:Spore germination protein n=1 Tax=Virgibacillus profundi TaxID=2024555 RepID=A0A2A2IEY2_9BACI|nr:spore germination protein [Virgibacillus profundi]PAV29814.1 spore germination protein [Virgibacillus profundi]PXY53985.1 spore germination protein [Virgibacillus profundi]